MADIQTYIDQVVAFADDMQREAEDAAEKLENIASLPYLRWIGFLATQAPTLDLAQRIDAGGELPTLAMAEMNYDLNGMDPNRYRSALYDSGFFKFILPVIQDQISNGGVAISQAVQDALFDNMRERDLRTMNDALDAAEANIGRRGFPLPSSLSQAARNTVIGTYQETRDNRNREVTALLAERAQEGMLALIDKGTTIEKAQMDFAAGFARVFIDIGNQIVQKFRAEQEAYIAQFDGQVRTIMSRLQIEEMNERILLGRNDQTIKRWEIESSHAIEKTKALIAQAGHNATQRVNAATSLVDFWGSAVTSANSQINAIINHSA